jgi:hypothetical protein
MKINSSQRTRTWIAASTLLLAILPTQAQTTVTLYPNLAPGRIPGTDLGAANQPAYNQNVLAGLKAGSANFGGSQSQDPAAFNTIGSPIINSEGHIQVGIDDIISYPVHSWRGKVYQNGPFAEQYGTFLRTSAHIESTIPFTTHDIEFGIWEPLFQFNGTLDSNLRPDSYEGISWGPDQQRGTSDDIVYTGDSLANPGIELNELNTVGPGWIGYYLPGDLPSAQEYFQDNRAYVETFYNGKYEARAFIGLRDNVSAVTFTASVPDSGPTLAASGLVLVGMLGFARRQRR